MACDPDRCLQRLIDSDRDVVPVSRPARSGVPEGSQGLGSGVGVNVDAGSVTVTVTVAPPTDRCRGPREGQNDITDSDCQEEEDERGGVPTIPAATDPATTSQTIAAAFTAVVRTDSTNTNGPRSTSTGQVSSQSTESRYRGHRRPRRGAVTLRTLPTAGRVE